MLVQKQEWPPHFLDWTHSFRNKSAAFSRYRNGLYVNYGNGDRRDKARGREHAIVVAHHADFPTSVLYDGCSRSVFSSSPPLSITLRSRRICKRNTLTVDTLPKCQMSKRFDTEGREKICGGTW